MFSADNVAGRTEAAVLLADITGSTPLYETMGDAFAMRQIAECLGKLRSITRREGGVVIRAKGDDVLCSFAEPSSALRAAREMLSQHMSGPLEIHAGMHFGEIIQAHGDVFGDTVNLTARLTALANPGELLLSSSFVDQLPEMESRSLRVLDNITFKGKSSPTIVYSLSEDDPAVRTEVALGHGSGHTRTQHQQVVPEITVILNHMSRSQFCREGASLSIGRSADCDVVIGRPWVSRRHAAVTVRRGYVQLSDRSTSGTYVSMRDDHEFFMRRETVTLAGSGIISPAMRSIDPGAEPVRFEVVHRRTPKLRP